MGPDHDDDRELAEGFLGGLPTTEVPYQESHIVAPSDFFATKEEKEAVREWEASRRQPVGGARRR